MPTIDLAAIRERHAAATKGPWVKHFDYKDGRPKHPMVCATAPGHRVLYPSGGGSYPASDLDFIAHSWQDIKDLLDEVERLGAPRVIRTGKGDPYDT